MKYLKTYENYSNEDLLMEGWLGDKMKQLSSGAKAALKGFVAPFQNVLKNIKSDWKDGVKAEEIKQQLIDTFKTSFDEAKKNLAKIEDPEEIDKLMNDMELSITQFNDTVTKQIQTALKESVIFEGKGDLLAAQAGVSAVMKTISGSFGKLKDDFKEAVAKEKNIQGQKKVAQKELDKMWNGIENQITKLDIKGLMDEARKKGEQGDTSIGDEEYEIDDEVTYPWKDGTERTAFIAKTNRSGGKGPNDGSGESGLITLVTKKGDDGGFNIGKEKIKKKDVSSSGGGGADKEYEPGDELTYTKEDGEENTATVAHNQKGQEEGMIRLQSADGKSRFNVPKSDIKASDNDEKTGKVATDLKDKLGKIKDDKEKMKKVLDFVDKL